MIRIASTTLLFERPRHRSRRGLSIMEVLFAIGVLTIGLMGVAFILPVATNNASQALRDDRAAEEINNRVAQDVSRLRGNIIGLTGTEDSNETPPYYVTFTLATQAIPNTDLGFVNNGGLRYFDVPFESLPNAFCIDPLFLASANNLRFTDAGSGSDRRIERLRSDFVSLL